MKHFLILALVLVVIVCMLTGCKGKENPTDMMQDAMTTISEGLGDITGNNTSAPATQATERTEPSESANNGSSEGGSGSSEGSEGSTGESESNVRARHGMNRR